MRRVVDIKEPELSTPVLLLHTRMLLPCGHKHLYPTHTLAPLSRSLSLSVTVTVVYAPHADSMHCYGCHLFSIDQFA